MVVKSHRQLRHEREHNELADWLVERIDALKPHATQIALVVIVAVVAILGTIYYFSTDEVSTAQEWTDYFGAFNKRNPEKELEALLKAKPTSVAGIWAAQTLGDMNVARGSGQLFRDRTLAKDHLTKAEGFYKQVEAANKNANLTARARLGLAKVAEGRCDPKEALKYYELVAASEKGTVLGEVAEQGVQRMKNPRDVELLAWFEKQTPKIPTPLGGPGGLVPGLPNDLPERPDISLPGNEPPLGLGLDNIGTPESPPLSLPATGEPEPGATKPADSPPAETPPAEAKPSDAKPAGDQPAEAKPAEEKPAEPKRE